MENGRPEDVGIDSKRLARLGNMIKTDIGREKYDGAVVGLARRGKIVMHEAFGFAERAKGRAARTDDVFHYFSVTKAPTAVTVLSRVERGELSLTTPIAEVIPEFGAVGKQRITVAHLLTHTGGMMTGSPPLPPEKLANIQAVVAFASQLPPETIPGETVSYSSTVAHCVLAEVVRRLDGGHRSFREILTEEVLDPLGMRDSWLGLRRDLAARRVPVVVRDRGDNLLPPDLIEGFNQMLDERAEMPFAGMIGTVADLLRFAEMLRCGGELNGARILSPAMVRLAATIHTGLMPNNIWNWVREKRGWPVFPANLGLSLFVRGEGIFPIHFGTLASPSTFGAIGAGSAMFWADPERELSFACLTAGLLEESRSLERFQRLSDLVFASLTE